AGSPQWPPASSSQSPRPLALLDRDSLLDAAPTAARRCSDQGPLGAVARRALHPIRRERRTQGVRSRRRSPSRTRRGDDFLIRLTEQRGSRPSTDSSIGPWHWRWPPTAACRQSGPYRWTATQGVSAKGAHGTRHASRSLSTSPFA